MIAARQLNWKGKHDRQTINGSQETTNKQTWMERMHIRTSLRQQGHTQGTTGCLVFQELYHHDVEAGLAGLLIGAPEALLNPMLLPTNYATIGGMHLEERRADKIEEVYTVLGSESRTINSAPIFKRNSSFASQI